MKASEIREMNPDELVDELERLDRKLFDMRTQAVTEKRELKRQARGDAFQEAAGRFVLAQQQKLSPEATKEFIGDAFKPGG